MTKGEFLDLKKEVIFRALDRNFEWAKRTNEISMQVKKWAVSFWLVFIGFFFSVHAPAGIQVAHYAVGLMGMLFFALVDALQHYYSEVLDEGRIRLMRQLEGLSEETEDQLRKLLPAAGRVNWSTRHKFKRYFRMFSHETVWAFYGALGLSLMIILRVLTS